MSEKDDMSGSEKPLETVVWNPERSREVLKGRHVCPSCGRTFTGEDRYCSHDGIPLGHETAKFYSLSDPRLGTVLGGIFRLKGLLGQGRLGRIYRAHVEWSDQEAVVRLLAPELSGAVLSGAVPPQSTRAFMLSHPGLARVLAHGRTEKGEVFVASELVQGRPLTRVLQAEAPLEVERALILLFQLARTLGACHEAGVLHGDLRPSSMMVVDEQGWERVKVLDLGQAMLSGPLQRAAVLGRRGEIYGDPSYMSPEQAGGELPVPASDIYALGIIWYEMLWGQVPFGDRNPRVVLSQQRTAAVELPWTLRPDLAEWGEVQGLLASCLAKDPEARPRDGGELAARLGAWLGEAGETKPPVPQAVAAPIQRGRDFMERTSEILRAQMVQGAQSREQLASELAIMASKRQEKIKALAQLLWVEGERPAVVAEALGNIVLIENELEDLSTDLALLDASIEELEGECRQREAAIRLELIDINLALSRAEGGVRAEGHRGMAMDEVVRALEDGPLEAYAGAGGRAGRVLGRVAAPQAPQAEVVPASVGHLKSARETVAESLLTTVRGYESRIGAKRAARGLVERRIRDLERQRAPLYGVLSSATGAFRGDPALKPYFDSLGDLESRIASRQAQLDVVE